MDINTPGTYTLTYTAHQMRRVMATSVTRNVTVVDTIAPIITRTGDQNVTHEAATSYTDQGATASDTLDGNLTSNVVTTGMGGHDHPGTYTLTCWYQMRRATERTPSKERSRVEDTTAPVITLKAMPRLIFGYGKPTPRMEPLRATHSTAI